VKGSTLISRFTWEPVNTTFAFVLSCILLQPSPSCHHSLQAPFCCLFTVLLLRTGCGLHTLLRTGCGLHTPQHMPCKASQLGHTLLGRQVRPSALTVTGLGTLLRSQRYLHRESDPAWHPGQTSS